ncbi:macrolide family glycosyltransferase [Allokutzneria oryzae]|uniref:Macrolide family glycosyltransferase n=1 Tax=Allokutzneria oryzae TaxID=1378989 RepID=A0ABV6AAV6_9PSEU
MAHIAFFAPSAAGHINPTLGMVAELTARGHRVTYATTPVYAERVAEAGAEIVHFDTTIAPPPDKPFKLSGVDLSRGLLANLRETRTVFPKLLPFYERNTPDLVIFDGIAAWWGRLIAQKLGVPCMPDWTTFVSNSEWSLMGPYIKPNPFDLRLWGFAIGMQRLASKAKLTMAELVDGTGTGVRGQLVFMPRSFQFAQESFGEEFHFIGPCLGERASQGEWQPPASGRPVCLVSLGTIYTARPEFFADVIKAFTGSKWHVVLAVSDRVDRSLLGKIPENIEIHSAVPQMAILPHTDLFINHAGITSVMEAVHFGVPMIAVPQMVEQRATADRMEAVNIGRHLPPEKVTVDVLRKLIDEVSEDQSIKDSLVTFKKELDEAGGTTAAVKIIEEVVGTP